MNYVFFDKSGNNFNLTKTNGIYVGNLYFDITSVKIASVQHIYVLNEYGGAVNCTIAFEDGEIFRGFSHENGTIINDVSEFNSQINVYAEYDTQGIYEDKLYIYINNAKIHTPICAISIKFNSFSLAVICYFVYFFWQSSYNFFCHLFKFFAYFYEKLFTIVFFLFYNTIEV